MVGPNTTKKGGSEDAEWTEKDHRKQMETPTNTCTKKRSVKDMSKTEWAAHNKEAVRVSREKAAAKVAQVIEPTVIRGFRKFI